jgi:hypothetical protein
VYFPADNFEQKSSESSSRVQSRLLGMRKTSNACVDALNWMLKAQNEQGKGQKRSRQNNEELSRPSAGNDRAKASSPSHAAPGTG